MRDRLRGVTAERVGGWGLVATIVIGVVAFGVMYVDQVITPIDCLPVIVAGIAFCVAFWNYANPEHWTN